MHAARKVLIPILFLSVAALATNGALAEGGAPISAQPQPPTYEEFYWDDGMASNGWAWYTGGNYWAVQFDDSLTGGSDGYVDRMWAMTYPGWPDSTYVGCYLHIFDDIGGYPGESIFQVYYDYDDWADGFEVYISTGTFYVAFEQIGNYPADLPDSIATDAAAGTHNWTGYQGGWANTTSYGDFLIRCYWEAAPIAVEDTTWGGVKGLYR
jgi:hypothetical protein